MTTTVCQEGKLCQSGSVQIDVPFLSQKYNWDCGLACSCMVLRYLGKSHDSVYNKDLELLQCGESVWTIHLALLMKSHGVHSHFYTVTLGVDKNYAKQNFYREHFNNDEARINKLFESAVKEGISVEKRSVKLAEILQHLDEGNVLICLTDSSVLSQSNCFTEKCVLLTCFGDCRNCYQGHFIVVCGYNKKKHLIYYRNPALSHEIMCSCNMKMFDTARKQFGTDEDILFIYND